MELKGKFLTVALLMVGLLVACGTDLATEISEDEVEVDPGPVLEQAVTQLLALESASFRLNHLKGSTALVPGVSMTMVSGEISIPDRFSVTVEARSEFPKSYLEISIVTIENTAYMTNIFGGGWNQISPDSLPFNLLRLGQTLAGIVDAMQSPRVLGEERLNGIDTLYINGTIDSQDLAQLVPGAGEGFPVSLELWLDQSQGLLQKVLIVGRVVPTDDTDTVRELTLKDINQPVNIEVPSDVSG